MKNMDMLVKLYCLEDSKRFLEKQHAMGVCIRKPLGGEMLLVRDWVLSHFSASWGSEAMKAMMNSPITCFIAIAGDQIIGFSCYDTTALGFCGPIGVLDQWKHKHTGKALLLSSLLDMKSKGYGYAIIGWTNETTTAFYEKTVNAIAIPDSFPGLYKTFLKKQ